MHSPVRMATASAMTDCSIAPHGKGGRRPCDPRTAGILRAIYFASFGPEHPDEEDLVDQLFNSSEKRLARVLLLLANFGKER